LHIISKLTISFIFSTNVSVLAFVLSPGKDTLYTGILYGIYLTLEKTYSLFYQFIVSLLREASSISLKLDPAEPWSRGSSDVRTRGTMRDWWWNNEVLAIQPNPTREFAGSSSLCWLKFTPMLIPFRKVLSCAHREKRRA
jgi:hypothetical protein